MDATTLPTLQTRSIGQLLDQAIRIYRRNFFKLIGIIALVQIPASLIQLAVSFVTTNNIMQVATQGSFSDDFLGPRYWGNIAFATITPIISYILIQGIGTAALIRAIADSYFGKDTGILDAYKKLGSSWYRLLFVLFLVFVCSIAAMIWLLVPCVGWLTGPGVLMFIGLAISPLIAPIVVLEQKTGGKAIRRAWDLARRRFWWLIGFVFLLYLFGQLIISGPVALAVGAMTLVLGDSSMGLATPTLIRSIIQTLIALFTSTFYLPIQVTALTLVYFDLRIRSEGLDLALQADSATESSDGYAALITQAPAPENKNLLTTQEAGYFVGLSVVGALIYAVLVGVVIVIMYLFTAAIGAAPF